MERIAHQILEALEPAKREYAYVAYGTIVEEIKEVSRSYKEARMALDVGKIFFSERNVIAYSSLGIGRLIYQLPIPLCKMFIREIFDCKSPDDFDEETLTTINKFFENSLNVSETSRQLYIHRNTLVYRLDKLQAATGLDPTTASGNIAGGCYKLGLYLAKYGSVEKAAMAYNMGEGGARSAWDSGITSTDYSKAVKEAMETWECTVNAWGGV